MVYCIILLIFNNISRYLLVNLIVYFTEMLFHYEILPHVSEKRYWGRTFDVTPAPIAALPFQEKTNGQNCNGRI